MAHVLDWQHIDKTTGEYLGPDGEKVRQLIKNGKAKGYTRELVHNPVNAPRLPMHISRRLDGETQTFGTSACRDL